MNTLSRLNMQLLAPERQRQGQQGTVDVMTLRHNDRATFGKQNMVFKCIPLAHPRPAKSFVVVGNSEKGSLDQDKKGPVVNPIKSERMYISTSFLLILN